MTVRELMNVLALLDQNAVVKADVDGSGEGDITAIYVTDNGITLVDEKPDDTFGNLGKDAYYSLDKEIIRIKSALSHIYYNEACYALGEIWGRIGEEKHQKIIEAKVLYGLAEDNVSQNKTIQQLKKRVKLLENIISKVQRMISKSFTNGLYGVFVQNDESSEDK